MIRRIKWKEAFVLIVACTSFGCGNSKAPSSRGYNLVLLSVDTLRSDHLGMYGYERATSPFIDGLAEESYLFEQFFHNGGGTLPSHLTMLTSLSPITHRIHPGNQSRLPDQIETLAEVLLEAGYSTKAITDGGWMNPRFGFDQGFEEYEAHANEHLTKSLPRLYRWLDSRKKDRPFFVFLHTYDVHSNPTGQPYSCPAPPRESFAAGYQGDFDGCVEGRCASKLLGWLNSGSQNGDFEIGEYLGRDEVQYLQDSYDDCIAYVDTRIQELVEELKARGEWEKTIFVLTSDHGEEFLDHGLLLHHQGGYQEISKIPLMIRVPEQRHGKRLPGLAAMIDLMPTLLDLLELESPPHVQGRSLVPVMKGVERTSRRFVHMYSVLRTRQWLFFRNERRLFDVEDDPEEQINLFGETPDVVSSFVGTVGKIIKQDRQHAERLEKFDGATIGPLVLSEEEIENLKTLGYLN